MALQICAVDFVALRCVEAVALRCRCATSYFSKCHMIMVSCIVCSIMTRTKKERGERAKKLRRRTAYNTYRAVLVECMGLRNGSNISGP